MFAAKLSLTIRNSYYVLGNYRHVCGKCTENTPHLTHLYLSDAFVLISKICIHAYYTAHYPQIESQTYFQSIKIAYCHISTNSTTIN